MKKLPYIIRLTLAVIIFLLLLLAWSGIRSNFSISLQLGPAILRQALIIAGIILLFTLFFGRFYCSIICPLGIFQDLIGFIFRKQSRSAKNNYLLRYLIFAVFAGLAAGGTPAVLRLEPYSIFGAIAGASIILLLIITALCVYRKRFFCTEICPVGTLLGLISKFTIFPMQINSDCLKCKKCEKICSSNAIDISKNQLDNEICVRCMKCLAVCPKNAIKFQKKIATPPQMNQERRNFLFTFPLLFLAGAGLGKVAGNKLKTPEIICPPGAGSPQRFLARCTNCNLCVNNCISKVLKSANLQNHTVHLNYRSGMCEYNCNICSNICPTGALKPLTLSEKKRTRIGEAEFYPMLCVAVQNHTHCGACAEHCPTGALRMVEVSNSPCPVPKLNPDLCIGCGNCENPCPVLPEKAIRIKPVAVQTLALDPEKYFAPPVSPAAPEESASDEWLI